MPARTGSARGRGRPSSASSASCPPAASGSWPARAPGSAPWSYYSMKDGRPFFTAGLWAEAHHPATGDVADTHTVIITDANATMRMHGRMPAILATDAARRWIEPGPLPAELLVPYPAEVTVGRRATMPRTAKLCRTPGWRRLGRLTHQLDVPGLSRLIPSDWVAVLAELVGDRHELGHVMPSPPAARAPRLRCATQPGRCSRACSLGPTR